jgi:hypothetical protein
MVTRKEPGGMVGQKGGASGFGEVAREFLMIWGRRQVNFVVYQVFFDVR